MRVLLFFICVCFTLSLFAEGWILIPMDEVQTDHLKAYGAAYFALTNGVKVEWLLYYRGGSFLMPYAKVVADWCKQRGVLREIIGPAEVQAIYATIEESNMDRVVLEKAPKIAVYIPPTSEPWDDAVSLALEYAEIPYDRIWDDDVLSGELYNCLLYTSPSPRD